MEGISDEQWAIPELIIRFLRAAHELNRCAPPGSPMLTPQQIRGLLYLVQHAGSTLKELAEALTLSETRASRLIEELVSSGHVLRERDVGDRRQVRLYVTPASSTHARRLYQQRWGALQAALSGTSREDVAVFARIFGRVVEELELVARPDASAAERVS
jgi:DNA-binding MarR family transcriptional regulator